MNHDNLLYLSRADVEALGIPMREVIRVVEEVFVEKGHGRVEMPPKPGIHPLPDAFIHAMPASIPSMQAAGIKWVSGYPQNMKKGLPYISGLMILNDPETGFPIAVMDCTWITAKRTGAASAVAARHLACPDPKIISILGCGVQGNSNLEALKTVFSTLELVQAYDLNRVAAQTFCDHVTKTWKMEAVVCESPKAACQLADIVVTAGPILKKPAPVIERSWLKEGTFLAPVDFDSYLKPEVFASASRLFTDDLAQQQYYKTIGYFQNIRDPDGDLGDLVIGKKKGRTNAKELTIGLNLGIALEDMATAMLVYQTAKRSGIGRNLPL